MKKTLSALLTFVLLLVLSFSAACSTEKNGNQGSSADTNPPSSDTGGEAVDLWNVDDVDISHVGNNRLIAFTFDDGPTDKTNALLDVFESFNTQNPDFIAHATLFTIGSKITSDNSAVLSRAAKMNFELGNHTFTHTDLTTLSNEKIVEELKKTDDALKAFDGKSIHLVRPAGGHADARVLSLYKTTFINWTATLDTSDWQDNTTENDIYNKISSNLLDGGIVLMHQGYDKSIKAVKRLLPDLKAQGYQVVSVSELIKYYQVKAETGTLYDSFI